jgi:hypothetical protein
MRKSAFLVSTAVGLTLAATGPALTLGVGKKLPHDGTLKHANAQRAPHAPGKPTRNPGSRHHSGLKLASTVIFSSDTSEALGGGFALDSQTTVNCKSDCVIEFQGLFDFLSYYSYNQISLCPMVDGYFTNGSCYFTQAVGHGSQPVPMLTSQEAGAGTHVAAVYLYTIAPAYIGPRQTDYHVYK